MAERQRPQMAFWRTWIAGLTSLALALTLLPLSVARAEDGAIEGDEAIELGDNGDAGTEDAGTGKASDDENIILLEEGGLSPEDGEDEDKNEGDAEDKDEDDLDIEIQGSTVLYKGYCGNTEGGANGKNISWKLYSNGKLALTGTGSTGFYSHVDFWFGSSIWPGWHDYANQITSVSIGEGITELNGGVLANLPKITSVTLPASMKDIDQCVFYNCPKLTTVTLNDGLESIGVSAFEGTGVTKLTIPASVSYIDCSNFEQIPLDNLTITGTNPKLSKKDGVLFGNKGKVLLYYSRNKVGAYTVPSGVTEIANCAFERCEGLTQITLPEGLVTIGEGAFNMSGICTPITIPNSVKTIKRQAFGGLRNPISKVHVGSGVTDPNWYMFSYSTGIQSIELANGPTYLGEGALCGCEALTKVYFPNSYEEIGDDTCNGCISLTSVRIGPKVKLIGRAAFANCTSLSSISIPNGVTTIKDGAFYNTAITKVTLPSSVTSIGADAFPKGCKVTFSSSLIQMDDGSYASASKATVLRYSATYKQTEARSMLSMINSFRTGKEAWWYEGEVGGSKHAAKGLKKLTYDYTLEQTAMVRAREIALLFSHTRPSGASCFTAFPSTYSASGENIAAGYSTAKEVMEAWKETGYGYSGQGHRRNMLSSEFNAVGIGHAVMNGVHYWVQDFGYASSPNTKTTTALDGKKTATTTIYNSSIESMSSAKASATSMLLKKSGQSATLPTITGKGIVLAQDGEYTWGSFWAKAKVTWKSTNKSVVKVSGGKAVAATEFGEAALKATAFGKTFKVKVYVGVSGDVSKLSVKISNKKYTGKAIKPEPTLKLDGKKLKLGTDYTLSYKNNKKVGKATLVIKGKGHYVGTKTVYFNIVK